MEVPKEVSTWVDARSIVATGNTTVEVRGIKVLAMSLTDDPKGLPK